MPLPKVTELFSDEIRRQLPFLGFHSLSLLIVPYVPEWSPAPHTCPASPLFFLGTPLPKSSVLLSRDSLRVLSHGWPEGSPFKGREQQAVPFLLKGTLSRAAPGFAMQRLGDTITGPGFFHLWSLPLLHAQFLPPWVKSS